MRNQETNFGLAGQDIICFAGGDWWYHHPHTENHILTRLAQQNRVLWVNSLTLGLPSVSNPDFFLKIRRKCKSYLRWLKRVPEGPYVMTPVSIPLFGSKLVRRLNLHLLRIQLRLAMRICGMGKPILWVCIPSAVDLVERLDTRFIVYQVSDKYDANEDSALSASVIREMDEKLKQAAKVVTYSGWKLFEESDLPNRYLVEQAVDFDHFARESPYVAADIGVIPKPVLGYMGAIDYVVDLPLIQEVSRRRPDWHWVFVGMKSNRVQNTAPNVHFLGSKPYSELPAYLRHFDVCVLPWREDSEFVRYGSAMKVREYLATGKPVVISPLYEYLNTPGLRIYHGVDDFIAAVEDALQHDRADLQQLRRAQVRAHTWDVRTRQVGTLLNSLVKGNSAERAIKAAQFPVTTGACSL